MSDAPKFITRGTLVYRQGMHLVRDTGGQLVDASIDDDLVCEASDFIEGAAEQIANALNRLPQAEALLVEVAQAIRNPSTDISLSVLADQIEEWMVNGG